MTEEPLYAYHPEIEGLKVNEDGTEVLINDEPQTIRTRPKGQHPFKFIIFRKKNIGVKRLTLECWTGMAPYPKMQAIHKDHNYENGHHSNLEWGNWGGNSKHTPKLTIEMELEIMELAEKQEMSIVEMAEKYNVERSTIEFALNRIQKRYKKG